MPCFWVRRSAVIDMNSRATAVWAPHGATLGTPNYSQSSDFTLFPSSRRHVIVCCCSKPVSGDTGEWDRATHPKHPYSGSDGPPFSNLDNLTAGNAWRENWGLICMWVAGTDHGSEETELVGTVKVPEGKMWLSPCCPQFTEWWTGLQERANWKHSRNWGL